MRGADLHEFKGMTAVIRGATTPAIGKAAAGDDRNPEPVDCHRDQHQAANIVLAGMACAFKAIDGDDVYAIALGGKDMPDGGAFVNDQDATRQ